MQAHTKGSTLGTRKPLKRLDLNFYCIGSLKLHVILGRKAALAVFRQRKAHKTDKESSLSFRFVAFARPRPSLEKASK